MRRLHLDAFPVLRHRRNADGQVAGDVDLAEEGAHRGGAQETADRAVTLVRNGRNLVARRSKPAT